MYWNICVVQGNLQYAYHSLQSFNTIKYILLKYNHKEILRNIISQAKNLINQKQSVINLVDQLTEQHFLESSHQQILFKELTKDAIEFFLWLNEGKYNWKEQQEVKTSCNYITDIPSLVKSLNVRQRIWQKFTPFIKSPLQRPICSNPSFFNLVSQGTLSTELFNKLVPLMKGVTIRDLSIVLKQSDVNVAKLLFPYIKQGVISLQTPASPYNRLPLIPASGLSDSTSNNTQEAPSMSKSVVKNLTYSPPQKVRGVRP